MKYLFFLNARIVVKPFKAELNRVEIEDRLIDSNFIASRITGSALFRSNTTVTARINTKIVSQGTMKQIAIKSERTRNIS